MKKKYELKINPSQLTEENQESETRTGQINMVKDPGIKYETCAEKVDEQFYDIPEEYLSKRIEKAEKDFAAGIGTPLEDVMKKFHK